MFMYCDIKQSLFDNIPNGWNKEIEFYATRGGHLLTNTSKEEQEYISKNILINNGTINLYWIGGFADGSRNWHWITDEEFKYSNFPASGQPDNFQGKENRLLIWRTKQYGK